DPLVVAEGFAAQQPVYRLADLGAVGWERHAYSSTGTAGRGRMRNYGLCGPGEQAKSRRRLACPGGDGDNAPVRGPAEEGAMDRRKVFRCGVDGSRADYEGGLRAEMSGLRAPGEPEVRDTVEVWEHEHLKRRAQLITSQPGWWAELKPLEWGMTVYRHARGMGVNCHVLTTGPH